jgi:type VI secretion system protein ImpJ
MSWRKKVVWSEGMLLQPQHLQQSERHADHVQHLLARMTTPYTWGFFEFEVDQAALAMGKFALIKAVGILADGTVFDMPAVDALPEPVDVPADMRDEMMVLALPVRRPGAREADVEKYEDLVRHRVAEQEVPDSNTAGERTALVQLGQLNARLMRTKQSSEAWTTLNVSRIQELRADKQVILDRRYIPPVLDTRANTLLAGYIDEILGLLRQRGDALAGRMTQGGSGGVSEIADFLMLQSVNRSEPLLDHMAKRSLLHPLELYETLLQLSGDLASFRDSRRVISFGPYVHDDLALSFTPVIEDLRRSLSMVLEQSAIRIDLHDRKHGVRVAVITDGELRRSATFVLAVISTMPGDALRSRFPTQVKVGPVERIRDLVNLQLPGVSLRPLPVAPRQIPFHSGANYFELETHGSDLWRQLDKSGGMAMHIAGEFPGLDLAFWAIRS